MIKSRETDQADVADLDHQLPTVALTRSGVPFHPNDDLWRWIDGPFQVNLDFRRFDLPLTVPVFSLKYTLC